MLGEEWAVGVFVVTNHRRGVGLRIGTLRLEDLQLGKSSCSQGACRSESVIKDIDFEAPCSPNSTREGGESDLIRR